MSSERSEAAGPEPLSTNVMNYLVWRYLQESGYDRAAHSLRRNWTGKEMRPDDLPFAASIQKGDLIHLVQDGLYMDFMQAEVKKTQRTHIFGSDHGPKFSCPEETHERRRVRDVSRRSSAVDREGQNGGARPTALRIPKRKSKSGGAEHLTNGDMMDIDGGSAGSIPMPDQAVSEVETPRAVIEEIAPIVDTLTIGASKESLTEQPRDLFPDTSFVCFEQKTILEHVKWSPHHSQALFTAGTNHMCTHQIKSSCPEDRTEQVFQPGNLHVKPEEFSIEAFCWTEEGRGVFSIKEACPGPDGDIRTQPSKLMTFTEFGQNVSLLDPTAGTIVSLQYNTQSQLLLSLCYGETATLRIWKHDGGEFQLKHFKDMSAELYDADWIGASKFIVCGISTLEIHQVNDDEISLVKSVETPHDWLRVKYDAVCDIVACMDEELHALGIMKLGLTDLKVQVRPFNESVITEFAFQPLPNPASRTSADTPRILATSTANGKVQIWDALKPFEMIRELSLGKQAAAQALAFSPDGFLLAAAGYDRCFVWRVDGGREPKAVWMVEADDERWKTIPQMNPDTSGEIENGTVRDVSDDGDWMHSLSWDADGKKIAFGLNGQVAIIRLKEAAL